MRRLRFVSGLSLFGLLLSACANRPTGNASKSAEIRAVEFLQREVPAWSRDNGCFSCHNNGDAARALYAATKKGYRIPKEVLADTTKWIAHPQGWDDNKGDPGFSDQRLADVQFAASLAAALEAGAVNDRQMMHVAQQRVVSGQADDGSWPIDVANPAGSPATYGLALATYMAWEVLRNQSSPELALARNKAEQRIKMLRPDSVPNAAVLVLFYARSAPGITKDLVQSFLFLLGSQTSDGGWGPYADSPPEVFDTSLVLLALTRVDQNQEVAEMIRRGRQFLITTQLADGSWPATTRPSGGDSYAQQISTTGWATLALLATH